MELASLYQLKSELDKLCEEVANFIKAQLHSVSDQQIESKDVNSLVSFVDKEAEKMIVKRLELLLPDAGFITEEKTIATTEKKYMWVIDPLDGTTNFLYKIPVFSTTIALLENKIPILGIVYDITQNTAYTAIHKEGAWENNKTIRVSNEKERSKAMVATGFPYDRKDNLDNRLKVLRHFILNYRGIRRLGSAAIDLAYVASGKYDVYYENTLNIWDIAAGSLIVQEAGGMVTDFRGNNNFLVTGEIVASNPHFLNDTLEQVKTYLT